MKIRRPEPLPKRDPVLPSSRTEKVTFDSFLTSENQYKGGTKATSAPKRVEVVDRKGKGVLRPGVPEKFFHSELNLYLPFPPGGSRCGRESCPGNSSQDLEEVEEACGDYGYEEG